MTARALQPPPQQRRPGWRALVTVGILLGLFLMHGMSASADTGCAGALAPAAASANAPVAASVDVTSATAHSASDTPSLQGCACESSMGASCVPRSQRDTGALLAAQLLALAWVSIPRPGPAGGVLSAARRARRTSGPTPLLALTCVCRT
jgi:hypothetical protein